ncbi:MAG: ABC transporter permease [Deltaproteobacteria bacterium]|jgi:peptide/nickel transport system permease protein|nr:ABC transporter permease [Deltaproteobacteria bacterium]
MKYFIRKVFWFLLALYTAVTVNFILPRLMPGDPVSILVNRIQGADAESIDAIRAAFGIDTNKSIVTQYFEYLHNFIKGDLGVSLTNFPTKVWDVLAQALPWTIGLMGLATLFSFMLGTMMGIFVAWRRDTKLSHTILGLFLFIRSFPYFWLGLILVYFFAFQNTIFPLGGAYSIRYSKADGWDYILSILYHGLLPGLTITISSMGYWMLMIRNNMINVLAEDYILVAKAKGLPLNRIKTYYAAKNAILPSVSGFAMALGFIIGGSIVTEIVFSYPGIGFMLFQAVQQQDYPLLQAIFLFIAIGVLIANFLSDIMIMILDPRVRDGSK